MRKPTLVFLFLSNTPTLIASANPLLKPTSEPCREREILSVNLGDHASNLINLIRSDLSGLETVTARKWFLRPNGGMQVGNEYETDMKTEVKEAFILLTKLRDRFQKNDCGLQITNSQNVALSIHYDKPDVTHAEWDIANFSDDGAKLLAWQRSHYDGRMVLFNFDPNTGRVVSSQIVPASKGPYWGRKSQIKKL